MIKLFTTICLFFSYQVQSISLSETFEVENIGLKVVCIEEGNQDSKDSENELLRLVNDLEKQLLEVKHVSDGRYEGLRVIAVIVGSTIAICFALLVLITGYNTYNVNRKIKLQAAVAFQREFHDYCERIDKLEQRAKNSVEEIESYRESAEILKRSMVKDVENQGKFWEVVTKTIPDEALAKYIKPDNDEPDDTTET